MIEETGKIRCLTAEDAELFVEFYAHLSEESLYFFTPHDPHPDRLRELISRIAMESNIRRFVEIYPGSQGEEIGGYMFLWDLDTGIPWLGICVRDSYKGTGVGTRLMRHAEMYCRQRHKGGILLTTHPENLKAQGLYRKVGYEQIGHDQRGEIIYVLRLKDPAWPGEEN